MSAPTTKKKIVKYRVVKPVFVNGSLVDPQGRKDVFVDAPEGLEGAALELVKPDPKPTGDKEPKPNGDTTKPPAGNGGTTQ